MVRRRDFSRLFVSSALFLASDVRAKELTLRDFGCKGDGKTDDRTNIIRAFRYCAGAGVPLIAESGVYACSDFVPLLSNLRLICNPGSVFRLLNQTTVGGFFVGGVDQYYRPVAWSNCFVEGIQIDCAFFPGQNGFCAINARDVYIVSPHVRGCSFDGRIQGGKAFQFEGGIVDGLSIVDARVSNSFIGISSQASPKGDTRVRKVSYQGVMMSNVDVPFNLDSQYANPENNVFMSTSATDIVLRDCGRLHLKGVDPLGGGVVCGDRGSGLQLTRMSIFNSVSYGQVGALCRGVVFDVGIRDVTLKSIALRALVDFDYVKYGRPTVGAHRSRVVVDGVNAAPEASLEYVVKGGSSLGRVGNTTISKFTISADKVDKIKILDAMAAGAKSVDFKVLDFKGPLFSKSLDNRLKSISVVFCEQCR